ncbi:MAG: small subunit ribosomal protein [Candidatus Hydrogenedentes bacterium]|nr:small subunit ribosomal protein [Candidatus Hydrogenedentota bacterium]
MSMSDPIADLLTRIRNGLTAGHPAVEAPQSRMGEHICAVLKREGYIQEFTVTDAGPKARLRIELRYQPDRTPVIQGLRRVSRPSLRIYVKHDEIRPVRSGLGISVLSTSKGIMTGKQARNDKVGGELLCEVW